MVVQKAITHLIVFGLATCFGTQIVAAEAAPLTLSIEAASDSVPVGKEIHVTALLTNTSQRTIHLTKMSAAGAASFEYKVEVRRLDSNEPVEKALPEKIRRNEQREQQPFTGSIIFIDIAPGETHRDDIDVSKRYHIEQPGKYMVQIERELPQDLGDGVLKSNEIQINVTP